MLVCGIVLQLTFHAKPTIKKEPKMIKNASDIVHGEITFTPNDHYHGSSTIIVTASTETSITSITQDITFNIKFNALIYLFNLFKRRMY